MTALTRTIGIALPIAILLVEARALASRRRAANGVLIAFSLVALAAVVLWDLRASGRSYLGGWFRMFVVDDPWSPAPTAGDASAFGLVDRIRENGRSLLSTGMLLVDQFRPRGDILTLCLRAGGTAAFLVGLWLALRRGVSVLRLYVLLFVTVATLHMVVGGDGDLRFLIPVLPFLFAYAIDGARQLANWLARPLAGQASTVAIGVLASCYVIVFVGHGLVAAWRGVDEAHDSPFGTYPIKRPQNFDAQRVALWVRDHSRPDDRYASIQRDMYDVLTERRGHDLVPGRVTPAESFVTWLDRAHVRYVIVDRSRPGVRDSLMAIIHDHPDHFELVVQLDRASLYEVVSKE